MDTETKKETLENKIHVAIGKHLARKEARKDGHYTNVRNSKLLETRYVLYTSFQGANVKTGSMTRSELTMDNVIGYLNGILDTDYLGEDTCFEFSNDANAKVGYSIGSYKPRVKNGQKCYSSESSSPEPLSREELRYIWGRVPGIQRLIDEPC